MYKGVFLGLGLVYLEWALNPAWRRGWRALPRAAEQWLQAALALVSALVFLLTRNLWLCLGVHAVLALLFWGFGREPQVEVDSALAYAHKGGGGDEASTETQPSLEPAPTATPAGPLSQEDSYPRGNDGIEVPPNLPEPGSDTTT